MSLLKTRQPIVGDKKDKLIIYIREHLDEISKDKWTWYSHDIDFTVDELREFADYIDWNCYFVYFTKNRKKNVSNEQALEFRDRDKEWMMMFQQRDMSEDLVRRWMWEYISAVKNGWKWIFKFQKLSDQFKEEYKDQLKKYCIDDQVNILV